MGKSKSKNKSKINIGTIIASIGAVLVVVSFFLPFLVGEVSGQSLSGLDITTIFFGMTDSIEGAANLIWLELITVGVPALVLPLQIAVVVGSALGCVILLFSLLGVFIKVPAGRLIVRTLSLLALVAGIGAAVCTGFIQAENTTTVIKDIVVVSMGAGAYLLACGTLTCAVGALFYKKK